MIDVKRPLKGRKRWLYDNVKFWSFWKAQGITEIPTIVTSHHYQRHWALELRFDQVGYILHYNFYNSRIDFQIFSSFLFCFVLLRSSHHNGKWKSRLHVCNWERTGKKFTFIAYQVCIKCHIIQYFQQTHEVSVLFLHYRWKKWRLE